MILVDSNVIIDVLTQDPDPRWRRWSQAALIDAADRDGLRRSPRGSGLWRNSIIT
jgi:predicted nucleic acid-binding protein